MTTENDWPDEPAGTESALSSPVPDLIRGDLLHLLREAQASDRTPSVSAALVRDGRLRWSGAVGLASVHPDVAATPNTQYRIGSITKTFTAVAIMQLRDAGAIRLDDPVTKHIAESPHPQITIRGLLSHLSGLQMDPPGNVWEAPTGPSPQELVRTLKDTEQVLESGTAWHYSNLGYALLGEILARQTKLPYEQVIDERVLVPLGLRRTTWKPVGPFAQGYFVEPYTDRVHPEAHIDLRGVAAAGQLWSNCEDLARWAAFLMEPDPAMLATRTIEEMHVPQTMADLEKWTLAFGLGLTVLRSGERFYAGHGGSMPGFVAAVLYSRKEKIGAAVMMNSGAGGDPVGLAVKLITKALDASPFGSAPWRPNQYVPGSVEGVLGHWWAEGSEWIFSYRDGRLEARLAQTNSWRGPTIFEEAGTDQFRAVSGLERGELLKVSRDGNGSVIELWVANNPFRRYPGPPARRNR